MSWIRGSSGMLGWAFFAGVALLLSFSVGKPASAASTYDYIDIDPIFEVVTADAAYSGTFDITVDDGDCFLWHCDKAGFVPGTDTVEYAKVGFLIFDATREQHDVAIIDLGDPADPFQQAIVDESDRFLFALYLEQIEVNVDVLGQLNADGTLDWKVSVADGNAALLLKSAVLLANGPGGQVGQVPEPTAALLFCLGFGVVGTAARKRRMH